MLDPRIYRAALRPRSLLALVLARLLAGEPPAPLEHDAGARRVRRRRASARTSSGLAARSPDRAPRQRRRRRRWPRRVAARLPRRLGDRASRPRRAAARHDRRRAHADARCSRERPGAASRQHRRRRPPRRRRRAGATRGAVGRPPRCSSSARVLAAADAAPHAHARLDQRRQRRRARARAALAARARRGPVDAVLVLGDLARRARAARRCVVPWSDGARRRAAAAAAHGRGRRCAAETGRRAGGRARRRRSARGWRCPLTLGEQGASARRGLPAVLLSAHAASAAARRRRAVSPGALQARRPRGPAHDHRARRRRRADAGPARRRPRDAAQGRCPPGRCGCSSARCCWPRCSCRDRRARPRAAPPRAGRPLAALGRSRAAVAVRGALAVRAPARPDRACCGGAAGAAPPGVVPFDGAAPRAGRGRRWSLVLGLAAARPRCSRLAGARRATRRRRRPAVLLVLRRGIAAALWLVNPYARARCWCPALHLWLLARRARGAACPRPRRARAGRRRARPARARRSRLLRRVLGYGPARPAPGGALLVAGRWAASARWPGCSCGAGRRQRASPPLALRSRPRARRAGRRGRPGHACAGPLTYAGPGSLGGTESRCDDEARCAARASRRS